MRDQNLIGYFGEKKMNSKTCTICDYTYLSDENMFHLKKPTYDGLNEACNPCMSRRDLRQRDAEKFKAWNLVSNEKKCNCCGEKYPHVYLQIDHIKPLLRKDRWLDVDRHEHIIQGKSDLNNLQLLCANCNQSKGSDQFCKLKHEVFN